MVSYEKLRSMVWKYKETRQEKMQPHDYLLLGILSKSVASVATFPYQLVKTRMQVRDTHFHRQDGILATVRSVWTREGIAGFYRGVVPATIRTAPHAAIMFATYEIFRSLLSETKL
jgi:solute carrier family 25 folate transporter 32